MRFLFLTTLLTLTINFQTVLGQESSIDWPKWLGPDGTGEWKETGIIDSIPEKGLNVVWRQPINGGYTSPSISEGRLFVMDWVTRTKTPEEREDKTLRGAIPGTERVLCLDAKTGEEIWQHSYESFYRVSYPGGPRACPLVEGDRVYSLGTMGQMICFDASNGEVHWEKNLAETYKTKPPVWGFASHPLIVGDTLYCTVGGKGSGVVAMNKLTGEEIWKALTAAEIGYAPPVLMQNEDGEQHLVVWYDVAITGLDMKSGEELWSHKFPETSPQRPSVSIATPRVIDNRVFVCNFYHGSILVEVGKGKTREVWSTEDDKQHVNDINTIMTTPVVKDGFIYGVAGNGEMRCVHVDSGQLMWRNYEALAIEGQDPMQPVTRLAGFAALFMTPHEDKSFLFTDQGELIIAKLSPTGYHEIGREKLLETTAETRGRAYVWCHPAFANGHMYVRNEKEIICVDLRAASYQ